MRELHAPAELDLATERLIEAVRRRAAAHLETPGGLTPSQCRDVERLMRVARALLGAGESNRPYVDLPLETGAEPTLLQEVESVEIPELLARRTSAELQRVLRGHRDAQEAVDAEAEKILEREAILMG